MKKLLTVLVALLMVLCLAGCGQKEETVEEAKKTIYVMGPSPDHGWTAQAGAFAEAKCAEIAAAGTYNCEYLPASDAATQNDQVNTIIANGDAAGVVMFALDNEAVTGQEALIAAEIPFISFDRFIEATMDKAILNNSGDNWQVGAGIANWFVTNGMTANDTFVILYGDNGTVCKYREEGFKNYLLGTEATEGHGKSYTDAKTGTVSLETPWSEADVEKLFGTEYQTVCNWSKDGALNYLDQKWADIVATAKAGTGNLYIYSMDDEMTFGVLSTLEALTDSAAADAEALNIYVSSVGGMQELYDVMAGKDAALSPICDKYCEGIIDMFFNPKMIETVIDYMLDYLAGNWDYEVGTILTVPTYVVDKELANTEVGFKR